MDARLGRYVETTAGGEKMRAFVPPPLPPNPLIDILSLLPKLSIAERALGRLDGITVLLPRQELFLYMYVRKEAVLSSQIEGTQSTLSDLLRFEAEAQAGQPIDDIREVSNYVDAMMYGLERLKELPLSLRLVREIHERLLQSGRGGTKNPGEFRRSQNWIGGTRPGNAKFVPPPVSELDACLDAFERFMHEDESRLPPLIKAGLLHVQFETIHPFLDGNGRIGRLLVTLYLCVHDILRKPLLYLSLYLKTHRADYYRLLQEVRERGTWEAWLEFFLDGVAETANQAFDAATFIVELFKRDRDRITAESDRTGSVLRVHDFLQQNPFVTSNALVEQTGLTAPTINAALADLERLGIVEEVTGRKRGRVFGYRAYLDILNEGTAPPPAG
jgi:Fic family protein